MDIPLGLKIINMVYKITTSKQEEIPTFFNNSDVDFIKTDSHDDIKLSKRHGLNDRFIDEFIEQLKNDKRVNLSAIGIMHEGKLVREEYVHPFSEDFRHVSFSMCKSIVSMAVGIAIEKEIISLNDKLIDIFPEYDSLFVKRGMRGVTIKHLLTMTSGVSFDELSALFSDNWIVSYLSSDLMFNPGEEFSYNSLNTYMVVAALNKMTGVPLKEFLEVNLFKYLDITDITWDMSPDGVEQGGWGAKLSIIDMLKLGQLYLDKGSWLVNGENLQLISPKWIEDSTKIKCDLADKEVISGYGYHIWILKDGAYLFNGLFGQNVYVNPDKKLVIAVTSSAYEVFPGGKLVSQICDFASDERLFDKKIMAGLRRLIKKPGYEAIKKEKIKYNKETFYSVLSDYIDNRYIFDEYAASLLPISIQGFYSMFSSGIRSLQLKMVDDGLCMIVNEGGNTYEIYFDYLDGTYKYQVIDFNGKKMPVAACLSLTFDEDDNFLLKITLDYLEEIGKRIFKIYFDEDYILLKAMETPDLQEFTGMLFGESKIRKTKNLKKIKTPEYMEYRINKILAPISKGVKE